MSDGGSGDKIVNRVSEPQFAKTRKAVLLRVFGSMLVWFTIIGFTATAVAAWSWLTFTSAGPLAEKKIYEIPANLSRAEIALQLHDQGIISDARVFSAAAAVNAIRGGHLKAGEYEFAAGATMEEVLAMITSGHFLTYKVTIPEGWTSQMVVARLKEQTELDGDVKAIPAEGSILPETYVFRRGLTRQKMIEDMQAAQVKLLDGLWQKHAENSAIKTKQEAITLASIVEKETGVPEERPMVASVFLNRLRQNIRLQSDPTFIYGLVGGQGKLDRPITKADVDSDTPYNTYKIIGLPPGPIANPGKAALEAVLTPADTNYLYFVANGSGGHAFAATLEEHNANVKKWRDQQGLADSTDNVDAVPPEPVADPVPRKAKADPVPPEPVSDPIPPEPDTTVKPGDTVVINGKNVPIPILKKPKK